MCQDPPGSSYPSPPRQGRVVQHLLSEPGPKTVQQRSTLVPRNAAKALQGPRQVLPVPNSPPNPSGVETRLPLKHRAEVESRGELPRKGKGTRAESDGNITGARCRKEQRRLKAVVKNEETS